MTWRSQLFPKIVTTGVSAATSSRRFGSTSGRFARCRVEPNAASFARSQRDGLGGREELNVLRVGAGPAALDVGHPVLVEHPGDPQLVGEREDDVLALGPVAERGVVEDDRRENRRGRRRAAHRRAPASCAAAVPTRAMIASAIPTVPTRTQASAAGAVRGQVGRPVPGVERRANGALHRVGRIRPAERPAQQHRRGQDRADRVGHVLPGDVRRRAVDRLVQPVQAVRGPARADGRRGQHPQRAGQDGRLVREDVPEEVLGDEHVERGRGAHDLHGAARPRAGASSAHVRILGRDLVDDRPPQARRRQHVRLVDAGEPPAAAARELEGQPGDPRRPRVPCTGAGRARRDAPIAPGGLAPRRRSRARRSARARSACRRRRAAPAGAAKPPPAPGGRSPGGGWRTARGRRAARRAPAPAGPRRSGRPTAARPPRRGRPRPPRRQAPCPRADRRRRTRRSPPRRRQCSCQSTREAEALPGRGQDAPAARRRPRARYRRPGSRRAVRRATRPSGAAVPGDPSRQRARPRAALDGHGAAPMAARGQRRLARSTARSLLAAARYASSEASMMFVERPWPVTTIASSPASVERRHRTKTRPWASSPAGDRADLVFVERRLQPTHGPDRLVDRADRARPPARSRSTRRPVLRRRRRASRCRWSFPPCADGDAPAVEHDRGRQVAGALLDEREEVGVGDLLLHVRQGDRLAVDDVERIALERRSPGCGASSGARLRPDSFPIDSLLPDRPTDWGVMIS